MLVSSMCREYLSCSKLLLDQALRHECRILKQVCVPSQYRRFLHQTSARSYLTNQEVRKKRSAMFSEEKERQKNLVPRIEKIEVNYEGQPENALLFLNKKLSTPWNICQHIGGMLLDRSALAVVNGKLWDMQRPLEEDCTVKLLHFHSDDPFHVNRAFWRSCSFMLSSAIEQAFKDDIYVELHSFPPPNVASGSFVSDVDLKMVDWSPTKQELMVFSAIMHRMAEADLPFERLVIRPELAARMFEDNQYKSAQVPSVAESAPDNRITVYRVGDHVDMSTGPMVGSTRFLGRRCTIPAAHRVVNNDTTLYRFQGVALPKDIYLNHAAYSILEERATRLNLAGLQTTRPAQPV